MPLIIKFYRLLFCFNTYTRGVIIHVSALAIYSLFAICLHYTIDHLEVSAVVKTWYKLNLSKSLVICMIFHLLVILLARRKYLGKFFRDYFAEKGSPYNLAIFRILFFFNLGGYFLYYSSVVEISWAALPYSSRVGLPYVDWLVKGLIINPELFYTFSVIAGVLCWMVCLGFLTRYASLLLIPFAFYVLGVPMFFGKISHYHILLWVPVFLCLSPMADVWSLDGLIKRWRKKQSLLAPEVKYFLPFKILWLQLSIIYGFAGLVKLWDCGLDWALSSSMVNQMRWEWVEHYDKVPWFRLDNYPVLTSLSGLAVIYFELLYFTLIFKPKGRIWAFIGTFSLHKLCGYFMYIDFSNLRLVAASYINWQGFVKKIRNKITGLVSTELPQTEEKLSLILKREKLVLPFIIGMSLVTINFICSSFKIHSYPFSSYPTYSAIVADSIQTLRMDAVTAGNKIVQVKQLGEKADYRWENIRPYEMRIAEAFAKGDSAGVQTKLEAYWKLWCVHVKGLDSVTKVTVYLETTSIIPEERHKIIRSQYLGVIFPLE